MNIFHDTTGARIDPKKRELLREELDLVMETDFEVIAASLATTDGFNIALTQRGSTESANKLAAMTSSMSSLGTAVSTELLLGQLEFILIEANEGRLVMTLVKVGGVVAILSIVTNKNILLGRVLAASKVCTNRIQSFE